MYVPIAQLPDPVKALDLPLLPVAWLVRTRGEPRTYAPAVERELKEVSDLPIARIRSLQEIREQSIGRTRFQKWLMVLFGGLASLLAGLGTYSVIAYAVRLRTREIGIRIALGAPLHQVRNTVMYQGMRLALAGIFAGLAASFWLAQLLTAFLYGVKPHDTLIFVAVSLFMMGVVLVAVWRPAQQATHVDPIEVLKSE